MGQDRARHLGQVHVAAATKAQHAIGRKGTGFGHAALGRFERRLRLAGGAEAGFNPSFGQRRGDAGRESGRGQSSVGDDQGAAQSHPCNQATSLRAGARTKDQFTSAMERPKISHRRRSSREIRSARITGDRIRNIAARLARRDELQVRSVYSRR